MSLNRSMARYAGPSFEATFFIAVTSSTLSFFFELRGGMVCTGLRRLVGTACTCTEHDGDGGNAAGETIAVKRSFGANDGPFHSECSCLLSALFRSLPRYHSIRRAASASVF